MQRLGERRGERGGCKRGTTETRRGWNALLPDTHARSAPEGNEISVKKHDFVGGAEPAGRVEDSRGWVEDWGGERGCRGHGGGGLWFF